MPPWPGGSLKAYALSVLAAMIRWLTHQRYVLANPFAGLRVRGSGRAAPLDSLHAFTEGEWLLIHMIADGLRSIQANRTLLLASPCAE